ncbi:MAG TPA: hypothetical protein VHW00_21920 [Thermoanaerobaculia bacterium]|nr:hypothetical protein [Thermoanaerobaculia bacterium]
MKRAVAAVLVLLSSVSAVAAGLGPERALAASNDVAAPFSQVRPDVASDGSRTLAVWLDARRSVPDPQEGTFSLYASRLDDDARPLTPRGIELARDVYSGAVASAGDGFLVLYTRLDANVYALRTSTGQATREATVLGAGIVVDLASNGSTYCALLSDNGGSRFWVYILDPEGRLLRRIDLQEERHDAVTATTEGYLSVGSTVRCDGVNACTRELSTMLIKESGATTRNVITSGLTYWTQATIERGDEGALVAWASDDYTAGRFAEYTIVNDTGVRNAPIVRAFQTTELHSLGNVPRVSAAFDGSRHLLGFPVPGPDPYSPSQYRGVRISASGALLDAQPTVLGDDMADGFAGVRTASNMLLLWSEHDDVVGRALANFAAIDTLAASSTVARSADLQTSVKLAIRERGLAVWREGEAHTSIVVAAFDPATLETQTPRTLAGGADVLYSAPSVAAASETFLTVWRESDSARTRVYARRLRPDGTPLDPQPLQLDDANVGLFADGVDDTAVATDGRAFLAVWRHEQELYGALIRNDGTLAAQPFRISRTPTNFDPRFAPAVVWTGSLYVVAWQFDGRNPLLLISPPLPPKVEPFAARVTREGVLLDTDASVRLASLDGSSSSIALATGAGRVVALFLQSQYLTHCLRAVLLTPDGQLMSNAVSLQCGVETQWSQRADIAAAFDGSAFVATWSYGHAALRGTRLTRNAAPFDPFEVSDAIAWGPALASWANGTIAAYSHVREDVGRAFARTIDVADAPSDPKRRATRH